MTDFESAFEKVKPTVEHLVRCKISSKADGDDVLGNIYLAAWQNYPALADKGKFRSWILAIADHKIKDYYAEKARLYSISIDECEIEDTVGFYEREMRMDVRMTLEKLGSREKQILYLYYLRGYAQKDIAVKLDVPLGTVKSRLHNAKKRFIEEYGDYERTKVRKDMENNINNFEKVKFPEFCPEYRITKKDGEIFEVVCEEIPGWLAVPRVGEKCSFAFYDDPDGRCTGISEMEGIRSACIHGIDCVQIAVKQHEDSTVYEHDLFVKLTGSHCLYVAEMRDDSGCLKLTTFMDDNWTESFGIGDNNCGRETHQRVNGYVQWNGESSLTVGDAVLSHDKTDLIGRYAVEICGKEYDTVAMLMMQSDGTAAIQHLNREGRTVVFRRFNRDDWKIERYGRLWTEKLPNSERMTINGEIYVHWYDCIPDHVITE